MDYSLRFGYYFHCFTWNYSWDFNISLKELGLVDCVWELHSKGNILQADDGRHTWIVISMYGVLRSQLYVAHVIKFPSHSGNLSLYLVLIL